MPREQREFYDEKDAIREYNNYKNSNDVNYMIFFGGLLVIALIVGIVYQLAV